MDCPKLKTSADTIVIDAMANNAFLGTDEDGLAKSGDYSSPLSLLSERS